MKAFRVLAMLLIASTLFTGCDFFRSILGKPTSKEIERMKIEAEAKAKKQHQLDSINAVQAEEAARIAAEEAALRNLPDRYYLILGSFKVESNATRMYAMLEKNGYVPRTIKFTNGFEVVSVKSFNNYHEALLELDNLRSYEFCPDDIWVYDKRQGLHVQ